MPEGWEIPVQSYEIKELGGKKSDPPVEQVIDRNHIYNVILLFDNSSASKKMVDYYAKAIKAIEESGE